LATPRLPSRENRFQPAAWPLVEIRLASIQQRHLADGGSSANAAQIVRSGVRALQLFSKSVTRFASFQFRRKNSHEDAHDEHAHRSCAGIAYNGARFGREGFGAIGVSASGAADALALRVGNKLLGNPEGAAALEMTLLGGTFQFSGETWSAISGSDFGVTLGRAIFGDAHRLQSSSRGRRLQFGPTKSGARAYLCVRGGPRRSKKFSAAALRICSAASAVSKAERCAKAMCSIGWSCEHDATRKIAENWLTTFSPRKTIRVTEGPQWVSFLMRSGKVSFAQSYLVTEEANRMGIRLRGSQTPLPSVGENDNGRRFARCDPAAFRRTTDYPVRRASKQPVAIQSSQT